MKLPSATRLFSKDSRWNLVFSLTIGVRGWHKLPKIVGMACMWVYRRRLLVLVHSPIPEKMVGTLPHLPSLPNFETPFARTNP
jgi:hypothetical protein